MPSNARTLRFKILLSTILVVSAVLTSSTAASVFVASDAARRTSQNGPPRELQLDAFRHTSAIHALLDTLLAPLGEVGPLDSATLRAAVALTAHVARDGEAPASAVWIAPPTPRTDSLTSTEMTLLRTWARSQPLGPLWGYRVGLGALTSPQELPTRGWQPLVEFTKRNERDADSALVHGDVETATLRARETIAAARHFTDQPLLMDMLVGRAFMVRGAKLLARAARQGDDPIASSQATRLAELAGMNYSAALLQKARFSSLGVDLSDGRLQAIAADRSLPPAIRLSTLDAAVMGACLRTSEVLLGATSERHTALAQLAWAVSDIKRTEELTPAYFKALERFDANGPAERARGSRVREDDSAAAQIRWMVPIGVRNRYAYCRGVW